MKAVWLKSRILWTLISNMMTNRYLAQNESLLSQDGVVKRHLCDFLIKWSSELDRLLEWFQVPWSRPVSMGTRCYIDRNELSHRRPTNFGIPPKTFSVLEADAESATLPDPAAKLLNRQKTSYLYSSLLQTILLIFIFRPSLGPPHLQERFQR